MKAKNLGALSALTASICCLGPFVLILAGLGGLGLGAVLGKYHWYFILGAGALLTFAWLSYFKENKSCESAHCQMKGKSMTRTILVLASAIVLSFTGLNLYTYAKGKPDQMVSSYGVQVSIPVKGMSCFTCEIAIQGAVRKLPGVYEVKAIAKEGVAVVSYDSQKVSLDEIITAINETGYRAQKPRI